MKYAIEWTYGRSTDMRDGTRCGTYHKFDTAAQRAAWVEARRTEYTTQSGFREAIAASDSELRSVLRQDAKEWGEPQVVDSTAWAEEIMSH